MHSVRPNFTAACTTSQFAKSRSCCVVLPQHFSWPKVHWDVADRALISVKFAYVLSLAFGSHRQRYPHLLLSACRRYRSTASTRRRQLSIDISCPQGAQQQTSRTPLLLSVDGTDGRTPDPIGLHIYRYPAPHTMRAASVNS